MFFLLLHSNAFQIHQQSNSSEYAYQLGKVEAKTFPLRDRLWLNRSFEMLLNQLTQQGASILEL